MENTPKALTMGVEEWALDDAVGTFGAIDHNIEMQTPRASTEG